MLLLAKIPSEVLFAVAMGVLTMLLLRMSLRRYRQTKDNRILAQLPRPEQSSKKSGLDAPDNIARWEVHMHDRARELSAQLDSKMLALQHLTASAARQAERLEKAVADAKQLDAKQLDANASSPQST